MLSRSLRLYLPALLVGIVLTLSGCPRGDHPGEEHPEGASTSDSGGSEHPAGGSEHP